MRLYQYIVRTSNLQLPASLVEKFEFASLIVAIEGVAVQGFIKIKLVYMRSIRMSNTESINIKRLKESLLSFVKLFFLIIL